MAGLVDLPNGPSGRIPLGVMELVETESSLVLFDDGSIGKRQNGAPTNSDGTEYSMIVYSTENLAK